MAKASFEGLGGGLTLGFGSNGVTSHAFETTLAHQTGLAMEQGYNIVRRCGACTRAGHEFLQGKIQHFNILLLQAFGVHQGLETRKYNS